MSFVSTRRSAKPVKKRLGSIQEELQKSFPTADTLPEKTPDHLERENAAQKRHSEENVHDELQTTVKTPSNLQRKVAFCPPGRRRAPLLRCNMSDLKSVYTNQMGSLGIRAAAAKSCPVIMSPAGRHFTKRSIGSAIIIGVASSEVINELFCLNHPFSSGRGRLLTGSFWYLVSTSRRTSTGAVILSVKWMNLEDNL